jgi:hypothetical protein
MRRGGRGVNIVTAHPIIDDVLHQHRHSLGGHGPAYRNHVYRCLNYHQLLLKQPVPDSAALAWAVHDLGVWTANTFDYLEPSADLASAHVAEFAIADVDGVRRLVTEHHKLRRAGDRMTDAFRAADLVDVSRGVLAGRVGRSRVRAVVAELPYLGFHALLARGLIHHAMTHPTRPLPMLRW